MNTLLIIAGTVSVVGLVGIFLTWRGTRGFNSGSDWDAAFSLLAYAPWAIVSAVAVVLWLAAGIIWLFEWLL